MRTIYLIKEILMDQGYSYGVVPIGRFETEQEREEAYKKYCLDRKCNRGEEVWV